MLFARVSVSSSRACWSSSPPSVYDRGVQPRRASVPGSGRGVVCSSRVCPFRRRPRVGRRQHPRRTIAACNRAGLRVPGSGRGVVCSSLLCPFRRARVGRQHPRRTIAACNQAGLRVPGSGRDIQGGTRAAQSASASSAARCCCGCFCGCQTALGRHHAGEDAPVGAKPARTHPSCSATGTTRFPTF